MLNLPFEQFLAQNAILIALVSAWSLVWKGLALWRAGAVRRDKRWFIALLIINTVGILEIIYLFFVAPTESSDVDAK
jgi:methionyl-tRNA synthetase